MTKILVVDDERVIADTLAIILRRAGYDVKAAYDGTEAVEQARIWSPDLILCDVIMPAMNGIEAAICILEFLPDCKILHISGQSATADLLKNAHERGYDFAILAKPVNPQDLLAKVRELGSSDVAHKSLLSGVPLPEPEIAAPEIAAPKCFEKTKDTKEKPTDRSDLSGSERADDKQIDEMYQAWKEGRLEEHMAAIDAKDRAELEHNEAGCGVPFLIEEMERIKKAELEQLQHPSPEPSVESDRERQRRNSAGVRLGYQFSNRPVEKIVSFGLTMGAFLWFAGEHQTLSKAAGAGFFAGTFATFFINILGVSAISEGWLLMAAMGFIWLRFGLTAFGTALLASLMFTVIMFAAFMLGNRLLNRKK